MDGYVTIGTELDLSGIEKKLDQMVSLMEKKSSQGAEKAAATASKKLVAGLSLGVGVMTNIVNKLMNVISSSISGAISRTDTLNTFSLTMESLGVSSKDASESIQYMSDKLQNLPTTLDQGAMAVKRFTSANNNVKASTEMFLALNNALLAGGTPIQNQAMALEQVSQAYAKGKPDMMEWRTMLSTMPAQLNQIAEAMGYGENGAYALGEALRKGEVSMNDFMLTMIKLNKMDGPKSLEKQAEKGTGGIQTAVYNLKNAVVRAVAEVIQTIGHQNIARFINNIRDAIVGLFPYIAAFVKSIIVMVNTIASVLGKLAGFFNKLFGKKAKKEAKETALEIGDVGYAVGGIGDSADKATGSAKKLNKELSNLQGFDEMNVLQDTSDTGGSGGGASGTDVGGLGDLGALGNLNFGGLSDQIKKLTQDTDLFTAAVWGLIAAWIAFKLTHDLLMSLGIGLLIMGIVYAIEGLIKYLKDPSFKNFGQIIQGIGIAVTALGILILGLPGIIVGVAILIIGTIMKYWDEISAFLSRGIEKMMWKSDEIRKKFGDTIGDIYDFIVKELKLLLDWFDLTFKSIKGVFDGLIKFIKGVFTGDWKLAWEGIKQIFGNIWNWISGTAKIALESLINKAKSIATTIGNVVSSVFKSVVNAMISSMEAILNKPISAINLLIGTINTLPGVNMKKLQTFKLPRLAKGGIINQPGRGVAIGGEAGKEGIIPLTDSQQMALLGEAIGKYITINANITNTMNGRVISRELQKINNESDFAFNR